MVGLRPAARDYESRSLCADLFCLYVCMGLCVCVYVFVFMCVCLCMCVTLCVCSFVLYVV